MPADSNTLAGLSKELTSLVWLAGPLSGFIVQPLIGAMSDNSSSRYRRRRWVVYTSIFIVTSTLILAFAGELAAWLVDLFNSGAGDWDPKRRADVSQELQLPFATFRTLTLYVLPDPSFPHNPSSLCILRPRLFVEWTTSFVTSFGSRYGTFISANRCQCLPCANDKHRKHHRLRSRIC